jgi:hypothetical protein
MAIPLAIPGLAAFGAKLGIGGTAAAGSSAAAGSVGGISGFSGLGGLFSSFGNVMPFLGASGGLGGTSAAGNESDGGFMGLGGLFGGLFSGAKKVEAAKEDFMFPNPESKSTSDIVKHVVFLMDNYGRDNVGNAVYEAALPVRLNLIEILKNRLGAPWLRNSREVIEPFVDIVQRNPDVFALSDPTTGITIDNASQKMLISRAAQLQRLGRLGEAKMLASKADLPLGSTADDTESLIRSADIEIKEPSPLKKAGGSVWLIGVLLLVVLGTLVFRGRGIKGTQTRKSSARKSPARKSSARKSSARKSPARTGRTITQLRKVPRKQWTKEEMRRYMAHIRKKKKS